MMQDRAQLRTEAVARLEVLRSLRVDRVSARRLSNISKLPMKIDILRHTMLLRAIDLADEALRASDSGSIVASCLLARALLETIGMFHWLCHRIDEACQRSSLSDVDDF